MRQTKYHLIYIVAPCMLIVLSPSFVQLMHTNYYRTVKQLQSITITIVAPTCFGLHKPSSGSSQPLLHQSYNVDISYIYRYLKLLVLWLHILFSPLMHVDRALRTLKLWIVHCAYWNNCTPHYIWTTAHLTARQHRIKFTMALRVAAVKCTYHGRM
jgi:hypothetical protein